jgi:hypothetical protein
MIDPYAYMEDTAKMDSWWASLDGMWELGIFLTIITLLSSYYALVS